MAKKPEAAAARPAALSCTFTLRRPIQVKDGELLTELTVQEPRLGHLIKASRKKTESEFLVTLLEHTSGQHEHVIKRVTLRDMGKIQAWLNGLNVPQPSDVAAGEAVATFKLLVPLDDGGKPVNELTLREPDIEAAIMVEKAKQETGQERTAAMIAALSGTTIPLVSQLCVRDLATIEAWLDPFADEQTSEASAPGAP